MITEGIKLMEIDPETVRIDHGRSGRKVVVTANRAGDTLYRACRTGRRIISDYAATLGGTESDKLMQMLADASQWNSEGIQGYKEVLEGALDWYLESLGREKGEMVMGVCAYATKNRGRELRFSHWDIGVWKRLSN